MVSGNSVALSPSSNATLTLEVVLDADSKGVSGAFVAIGWDFDLENELNLIAFEEIAWSNESGTRELSALRNIPHESSQESTGALIEGPGDRRSIAGIDVEAMAYSAPSMVRGAESHRELWARAGAAYNAGDYGAAERIFSKLEQGEFARDGLLYRGVSLLMLGRHDEALEVLERSREIADGAAVNYYAGLAALGSGDRDLATRALEEAAASGGEFGERAQTALSRLDTP